MSARPGDRARVLALVTAAFGGRGGIAQYNRDYIQALARLDAVETIDVLPRGLADPPDGAPAAARLRRPVGHWLAYAAAALKLAVETRPRIIFCGHLFMAPLAALACRATGARMILQLHGIEIWRRPSAAQRWALESADLVQCVSRDTRARALAASRLAPERVIVVPNAVADRYAPGDAPATRERLGLGTSKVLLSVGRLDPRERYKGHEDIIAIVAAMAREGRDLRYLVVGDGDDRARLEQIARTAGLGDRVSFLGHVEPDELPMIYRAADLFVLPSRGEGFGIVFLEAMASGVPAIGLATGGATDALDGLGAAVAPDMLEGAIRRALEDTGGDREALAARVHARFGRPVFESIVAAAIGSLLARGPAPSNIRADIAT